MPNSNKPIIISIEGNIGSGKSTFLRLLQEFSPDNEVVFLREPVDIWNSIKDTQGETILSKFYGNTKKYSFSFQMMAYISRLSLLRETCKKHPNKIIVTERCVETDKNVFAKMLYDEGNIEEVDYAIYLRWFDEFAQDFQVTKYVYVYTPPEVCSYRILKRNRQGEVIPLEYLKNCSKYHKNWLDGVSSPVLKIIGVYDITTPEYARNLENIFSFITLDI